MKDIVEELGLTQAQPADTPMLVSQSSKAGRSLPESQRTKCNTVSETGGERELLGDGSPRQSPRSIDRLCLKKKDMVKLKRVGPLLLGGPNTWTHCRREVQSDRIMAHTDSDWAADRNDKRSMSGGMFACSGGW